MTATELVTTLAAIGIRLTASGGRLKARGKAADLPADLRAQVEAMRAELVALAVRMPEAMAEAMARVDDLAGMTDRGTGRGRVLAAFRDLARRWLAEGNPMLLGVPAAMEEVARRWGEGEVQW